MKQGVLYSITFEVLFYIWSSAVALELFQVLLPSRMPKRGEILRGERRVRGQL